LQNRWIDASTSGDGWSHGLGTGKPCPGQAQRSRRKKQERERRPAGAFFVSSVLAAQQRTSPARALVAAGPHVSIQMIRDTVPNHLIDVASPCLACHGAENFDAWAAVGLRCCQTYRQPEPNIVASGIPPLRAGQPYIIRCGHCFGSLAQRSLIHAFTSCACWVFLLFSMLEWTTRSARLLLASW
jgi:hypothetical protein